MSNGVTRNSGARVNSYEPLGLPRCTPSSNIWRGGPAGGRTKQPTWQIG